MRSRFLLVPAALIASAPALAAHHAVSVEEGLATLFPGATLTFQPYTMEIAQVAALLEEIPGNSVYMRKIRAWKSADGNWAFLDEVVARGTAIVYLVGVLPDGSVKGVEVLECSPEYDQIQRPAWLREFTGQRHSRTNNLAQNIDIISGASLSSDALARGVRRVMAAYTLFFAAPQAADMARGQP